MGTLAESFLADLEDLSDASVSDREVEEQNEGDDVDVSSPTSCTCLTPLCDRILLCFL